MRTRPLLLITVAAAALTLGGCRGTENRGLESVHQPVVDRADYALDLQVAGDTLADGEPARLAFQSSPSTRRRAWTSRRAIRATRSSVPT